MKKLFFTLSAAAILLASCENDNGHGHAERFTVVDFESAAAYLAGPTSYGENLYATAGEDQYLGYHDTASDLWMPLNETEGAGANFHDGGVAVSQWNDMTINSYTNQCSVYHADATTGFGGHGGSRTFAVAMGNRYQNDETGMDWDTRASIYFKTVGTKKTFDHMWVANTAYNYLSVTQGDAWSPAYSYDTGDWLVLTVEGLDASGEVSGTVEFYLSDFRTSTSAGALTGWHKVDLRGLGEVHGLRFDMAGSDDGGYGTSKPVYFCLDDIAIVK